MKITKLSSITLATLLAFGATTISCNKIKDAIKTDVAMQQAAYTFELNPIDEGEHKIADYTVTFNVDSAIRANASQFNADNIKSVKISSVTVSASGTDKDNHFGLLSDCKADMKTDANTNPVTIAQLTGNPETATATLNLPVNTDLELKDYFKGSKFTYTLTAKLRKPTKVKLTCTAIVKFNITVGL